MASSTSEPMAMAMPPRLMVLMVCPVRRMTMTVMSSDRGMAVSEMSVTRPFIRNTSSTRTTKKAPSMREFLMLFIELSMKRDCRKISVDTSTSSGKPALSSAMVASSVSVRSMVLV